MERQAILTEGDSSQSYERSLMHKDACFYQEISIDILACLAFIVLCITGIAFYRQFPVKRKTKTDKYKTKNLGMKLKI
jgi:hypothetical protein